MMNVRHAIPLIKTVVRYELSQMKDIVDLAYALTAHKSQGGEYATDIIPVSTAAYMMTNELMYTVIARAKERVLLVGQSYMHERACKNLDETKRKTVTQELVAILDREQGR
jgi:exodeoxyribonuclease V alpha subunit